jgi:xanthine dehydrogenase molybdopterin-binding subunit B
MNPSIRPKSAGETKWVGDVKLPGMLHARPIHPATLGSKLISVGKLDTAQYPRAKVVVIGNLVAVVSPDEWEAVQAAQQVATSTQWSEWQGLPGHEKLFEHLEDKVDWSEIPARKGRSNKGDTAAVLAKAPKRLKASYQVPYLKHAPIGPTVSLADVKADGSVTLHTHSQNPQYLRFLLAKMLNASQSQIVVRTYPGPGHFGRSNGGNAGSEDEAVLLSRELRTPVRVQWMRSDDMQWSTQSSASGSRSTGAAGSRPTKRSTGARPCRMTARSAPSSPAWPPLTRPGLAIRMASILPR